MAMINGISSDEVKARLKEVNSDTPIIWTTSLMNQPQELSVRLEARNNIMLDKMLKNQQLIMKKLGVGENLDVAG